MRSMRKTQIKISACIRSDTKNKKLDAIELYSKGQFYENTAYLERDMPYFAFVSTNAVLVRKNDRKASK